MEKRIEVLDHGYVTLIESWGSDARIIEAARMSTSKEFVGWGPIITDEPCRECTGTGVRCRVGESGVEEWLPCRGCNGDKRHRRSGDEKLLRYLYDNKHATPFEFGGFVIEVQAPIFVFREWHRHRTQSYNEMSARYTPLPDVNYLPSTERLMINAGIENIANKQERAILGSLALTREQAHLFQDALRDHYERSQLLYQSALNQGIPKELARVHLPVGRYSRMRAHANLRNWLGFLTLRMAPNAQWEIRQYANAVGEIVRETFPRTWELFEGAAERLGGA